MFFLKKRLSRRPHSDQGVAKEFLLALLRRPHSDQGVATEFLLALLRRPHSDQGVAKEFLLALLRRPHSDQGVATEFLLEILCALTARTMCALRFHGVRTALSRRLHCAFMAFALH